MYKLNKEELELLIDIIEYIEDSEALDFENRFNDLQETPQEILFNDNHILSSHIFYKAMKLKYFLNKSKE